ncbi:ATP-binding cassette domain-containing protein [Piscinibacter koreensis]|uniref:ATP-binding cassette domain-containing protein n=1 Tax=Piscinibacter koreensis TaxID=2742824 RepID=UPI003158D96B
MSAPSATASPARPLLEVRGLAKSFGGVVAVKDASFDLAAGEMLALIGPNGAGKTTCFNMVGGQLRPDAGSVKLDGSELVGLGPTAIGRRGVARTFQIAETFGSLTVLENVQLALLAQYGEAWRGWGRAEHRHRDEALALLEQVGMAAQAGRAMRVLAYGDVKRVELALALAMQPRLLLMDEPTAGMGPAERGALMALTRRLAREQSIGVLFTEHSMDVVFAHADRLIVLVRGELIAAGPPAVLREDAAVRAAYLGGADLASAAQPAPAAARPDPEPAPAAIGRIHADRAPAGARAAAVDAAGTAAPLLDAADLAAWYGQAQILFGVSLQVAAGECVALMGRNGAGKSTTMKAIMGVVARRRGQVRFAGADLVGLPPHRISRLGVGWVPEDRRIFGDLTVAENLALGAQPRRADAPHWTEARVFELFPHLASLRDRLGAQMSGGEQQMLTVARTLMGQPRLILLDEPSEGVAPLVVEQMAETIASLKREGLAILLSEQNFAFARGVADRAVVLEKGQVRYSGSMAELDADAAAQQALFGV